MLHISLDTLRMIDYVMKCASDMDDIVVGTQLYIGTHYQTLHILSLPIKTHSNGHNSRV